MSIFRQITDLERHVPNLLTSYHNLSNENKLETHLLLIITLIFPNLLKSLFMEPYRHYKPVIIMKQGGSRTFHHKSMKCYLPYKIRWQSDLWETETLSSHVTSRIPLLSIAVNQLISHHPHSSLASNHRRAWWRLAGGDKLGRTEVAHKESLIKLQWEQWHQ